MDVDPKDRAAAYESILDGSEGVNVGALDNTRVQQSVIPPQVQPFAKLKKRVGRTLIVLVVLLIAVVVGTFLYQRFRGMAPIATGTLKIEEQTINPKKSIDPIASNQNELPGSATLQVQGSLQVQGQLRLVNADGSVIIIRSIDGGGSGTSTTITLPSGKDSTLCSSDNNCNFATTEELSDGLARLDGKPSSVINGVNGEVLLQGTANQVSVMTQNGVITLAGPQDLAQLSSPRFANLLLSGNLSANGATSLADAILSGSLSVAGSTTLADVAVTSSVSLGGDLILLPLNCSGFAQGGKLTTTAGGKVVCGDDTGDTSGGGGPGISGTQNYIAKFTDPTGAGLGNSSIYNDGTFVGIGTTVDRGLLTLQSYSSSQAGLDVQSANNATAATLRLRAGTNQTADILDIYRADGSVALWVNSSGKLIANLGINTAGCTSPSGVASHFCSGNANNVSLVLTGSTGQAADLLQFRNITGSIISSISAQGNLRVASTVDTQTAVPLGIGTNNASAVNIGRSGAAISLLGNGTATSTVLQGFNVAGDTNDRFQIRADGRLLWGSGGLSPDVFVERAAAGGLQLVGNQGVTGLFRVGPVENPGNTRSFISTASTGEIGSIVRGISGQTGDLLQLQDSAGTVLSTFNSSGALGLGTSSPQSQLEVKNQGAISSGTINMTAQSGTNTFTTSGNMTLNRGDVITPTSSTGQATTVLTTATGTSFISAYAFSANVTAEAFTVYRPTINLTNSSGTSQFMVQGNGNVNIGSVFRGAVGGGIKLGVNGAAAVVGNVWAGSVSNLSSQSNGLINLTDNGMVISRNIADANTLLTVQNLNASSTGHIFNVLNSGGSSLLAVNSTGEVLLDPGGNKTVRVGYGAYTGNSQLSINTTSTNWIGMAINAVAGQTADLLQLRNNSGNLMSTLDSQGQLNYYSTPGAGGWSTRIIQGAGITGNRIITLGNETGTVCVQGSANCGFLTGSPSDYIQNQHASIQAANINIKGAAGTVSARIHASDTTANALEIRDSSDVTRLYVTSAGELNTPAGFRNAGNCGISGQVAAHMCPGAATSTSVAIGQLAGQTGDLLQFQSSNGYIISRFTSAGRLGLNAVATTAELAVVADAPGTIGQILQAATSQTADLLQIKTNGSNITGGYTASGNLFFGDSGFRLRIVTAPLGGNAVVTIPNTGGVNDEVCLFNLGNCVTGGGGGGGGSITGTGATNYVARWTNSTNLSIGQLYDNGTSVGINNTAPGNRLSINTPTTADSAAQVLIATNGVAAKALVLQGVAGQSANIFQVQQSGGAVSAGFTASGALFVASGGAFGTNIALSVSSGAAGNIAQVTRGISGQTGDLFQLQGANGEILSGFNANGGFTSYGATLTISSLVAPTWTTASTGTTYYYQITATNAQGQTAGSIALGMANNTSTLQWGQIPGATGYKIYRNTVNNFSTGTLLLATITNGTTTSYTDTGSTTTSGLPIPSITNPGIVVERATNTGGDFFQAKFIGGAILANIDNQGYAHFGNGSSTISGAALVVSSKSPGNTPVIGQIIRGAIGQNLDLFQLQNNAGAVLSTFNAQGQLGIGTSNPQGGLHVDGSVVPSRTGTGTVTTTMNSFSVNGTGTNFTTELKVGDTITIGSDSRIIYSITSNTLLSVGASYGTAYTGQTFTFTKPAVRVEAAGTMQAGLVVRGASSNPFMVLNNADTRIAHIDINGQFYAAGGLVAGNGAFSTYSSSGSTAAITLNSGASSVSGNSGNITISSGNAAGGNSGSIIIDSGTAPGTTGAINIGTTNSTVVNIGSSSTATLIQGVVNVSGSNSRLTVGNVAGGEGKLAVQGANSTTITQVNRAVAGQTADLLQLQDSTNNVLTNFDASGYLHINRAVNVTDVVFSSRISGDANYRVGIRADGQINFGNGTNVADTSIGRYDTGVIGTGSLRVNTRLSVGSILVSGARLEIDTNSTGTIGQVIRGTAGQTANLLQLQNSAANIMTGFNAGGRLQYYSSGFSNSFDTVALTANHTVRLPDASGTVCLDSNNCQFLQNGGSSFGATMSIGTLDANGVNLLVNSSVALGFDATGNATFKPINDGTTSFSIQNAAGTSLFSVDTTNNRLYVGPVGGSTSGTLLVLGSKTTAGDPVGVDGAMYYNTDSKRFRCFEDAEWKDCIDSVRTVRKTADQTFSATTFADANDLSFPVMANRNYSLSCRLVTSTAAAGGGYLSMNGPASPSQFTATFNKLSDQSSGDSYATSMTYDDPSTSTTFRIATSSIGTDRFIMDYNAIISNGANSGTWTLRSKAHTIAGSSLTLYSNSSCSMRALP